MAARHPLYQLQPTTVGAQFGPQRTATNEPLLQAGEPSIGWCLMAAAILLLYGAGLAWVLYGFVNVIRVVWTSFAN